MTKRKFDNYTLWLRWQGIGGDNTSQWRRYMTCLDLGWPAGNPRKFLLRWVEQNFPGTHWDRKDWKVLGGDNVPTGYES